jgi:hypothetical protein
MIDLLPKIFYFMSCQHFILTYKESTMFYYGPDEEEIDDAEVAEEGDDEAGE